MQSNNKETLCGVAINKSDLRNVRFVYLQVISSIDVQSIEPVDQRMRDSLMKSVQMAIEIATQ